MRRVRRLLPLVAPVAVGVLGAWVAVLALGRIDHRLGPFDVEYFARPGRPATEIRLPPFGRIRADTHFSPVYLSATLESVDPERLQRAIRRRGVRQIVASVQDDAVAALRSHLLTVTAMAVAGALLAGVLVFRRTLRGVAFAALSGGVATTLLFGLVAVGFRRSAFLEPTFTGSLRLAGELIGPIRQAGTRLQEFRSELDRIVRASLEAYGDIAAQPTPTPAGIRVLRISDVHGSPIGTDFARQLAKSFDVDLVIDTGDITSFGTPLERGILEKIDDFRIPYLFVRGNHDSRAIGAAIDRIPNATVLENDEVEVAGLRIFGAPHPLYTPDPAFDLSHEQIDDAVRAAGVALAAAIADLPAPPDIVALHDDRMAETLAGGVALVVAGHFHEPAEAVHEGTIFLRAGSTGGGGVDAFVDLEEISLSAQILYFEGTPPTLVAYDEVAIDPQTRDFEVDRRLSPQRTTESGGEPASVAGRQRRRSYGSP